MVSIPKTSPDSSPVSHRPTGVYIVSVVHGNTGCFIPFFVCLNQITRENTNHMGQMSVIIALITIAQK